MTTVLHPRQEIYYWKCDRPVAFYGIRGPASSRSPAEIEALFRPVIAHRFPGAQVELEPGNGQGNHLTFTGRIGVRPIFVRIEDGPEGDDYMDVESHLIGLAAAEGVPVAAVLAADASRSEVPFAWQVLEHRPEQDLNRHAKNGTLQLENLGTDIGRNLARWQRIRPEGFGPFDPAELRKTGRLRGFHKRYSDYFFAHLDRHLEFLTTAGFVTAERSRELDRTLKENAAYLKPSTGVLVHKDLALWNILGTPDTITAFIDWDDAISGDVMDDLSLFACFHNGLVIRRVLAGYAEGSGLPTDYRRRFWMHLVRNMITKAVIRVGAGYFDRTESFFLIGAGASGSDLRATTLNRLDAALHGLRTDSDPASL